MTPVQLPEVPEPARLSDGVHHTYVEGYTAAQLREYATEAVMAEREEWRDLVQRAWRVLEIECPREPITDELLAALVNTDRALITPSETNSDR